MIPKEFRAWDLKAKEMIRVCVIDFTNGEIEGVRSNGSAAVLLKDEYILMQWTGPYDCKGVKVFEGDILRSFHYVDNKNKKHYLTHHVIWSEKLTGWKALSSRVDDVDSDDGSPQLWVYMKYGPIEVIGNIHEHGDLLEDEGTE